MMCVTVESKGIHLHSSIYKSSLETMTNSVAVPFLVSGLCLVNSRFTKSNQKSWKKSLLLDLEQEMDKRSLEYFVIIDHEEATKHYKFLVKGLGN